MGTRRKREVGTREVIASDALFVVSGIVLTVELLLEGTSAREFDSDPAPAPNLDAYPEQETLL